MKVIKDSIDISTKLKIAATELEEKNLFISRSSYYFLKKVGK